VNSDFVKPIAQLLGLALRIPTQSIEMLQGADYFFVSLISLAFVLILYGFLIGI
jgi:hypothetical protein